MEDKKEIKKAIENFKRANELETENFAMNNRERVLSLWGMIELKARCPRCDHVQNVKTVKVTTCLGCRSHYKVYPENSPSRVAWCSNKALLLQICRIELDRGHYHNIF
jgi:hypothetical protein